MSLTALDLINILFSVMGYHTCYCPSLQNSAVHLESATEACCSDTGGTYSSVLVRSDSRCQFLWLLTWLKWTVQLCGWFSAIYGLLPRQKCCGGLLCWILGILTIARYHTQTLTNKPYIRMSVACFFIQLSLSSAFYVHFWLGSNFYSLGLIVPNDLIGRYMCKWTMHAHHALLIILPCWLLSALNMCRSLNHYISRMWQLNLQVWTGW
jgi:hypothetical protein